MLLGGYVWGLVNSLGNGKTKIRYLLLDIGFELCG